MRILIEHGQPRVLKSKSGAGGRDAFRILVYGSSYLTEICCAAILDAGIDVLVGYVPSTKTPTVPGDMGNVLPMADPGVPHDFALSIQYDAKIEGEPVAFNLHTGLLPSWGGCDILYHTVKNCQITLAQGLTFHKITDRFDYGPIISTISYPVLIGDDIPALYRRQVLLAPSFVVSSLDLVRSIGLDRVGECASIAPTIYKRGDIDPADADVYAMIPGKLRAEYGRYLWV